MVVRVEIKILTLKSSIVTAREFITSASMVSSSRSIRSIFFLMACRAASEQRAARSAPTWPWVSFATYRQMVEENWDMKMHYFWGMHLKCIIHLAQNSEGAALNGHDASAGARLRRPSLTKHESPLSTECSLKHTCSRSTSSASFMFLVWIWSISSLPVASGMPMSTSLSKRPEIKSQNISTRCSLLRGTACTKRSKHQLVMSMQKTLEQNDLTKSPESRVNAVGSVSGCHDDDMSPLLQSVHQSEQLRHNAPLHLTMSLRKQIRTI